MCMIIEQNENPTVIGGQCEGWPEEHAFWPGNGNEAMEKMKQTKEGASSGSLALLEGWLGESAWSAKEWKFGGETARQNFGREMSEERRILKSAEAGKFFVKSVFCHDQFLCRCWVRSEVRGVSEFLSWFSFV